MKNETPKCDFCDKEAVHFCSQALSQSCDEHIEDANKIEDNYYENIWEEVAE